MTVGPWAGILQAARHALATPRRQKERPTLSSAGLRRIPGSSNHLYYFQRDGQDFVLKLFTAEGQDKQQGSARAEREWRALELLARQRVPRTPHPVFYDAHPSTPAIIMTRVPGRPIRRMCLTAAMLDSLAETLHAMHLIIPEDAPDNTLPILVDPNAASHWLAARLAELEHSPASPLQSAARTLAEAWLGGPDLATLRAAAQLAFARADANFANCLWDGHHVAIVDYEYCGWRDRAWDLADLIELDRAWSIATDFVRASDTAWQRFLERCELSATEHERFLAVQRWLAMIWMMRAWTVADASPTGPTEARFAAHIERVRQLCR